MLREPAKLLRLKLLQRTFELLRQQHLLPVGSCLLQREMLLSARSNLLRRRMLPGGLFLLRRPMPTKTAVAERSV